MGMVQNRKTSCLQNRQEVARAGFRSAENHRRQSPDAKIESGETMVMCKFGTELGEKITDFEQKGLSWLEPAREFVLSLNQAANLVEAENKEEMTTFLKTIGSNHVLENRQFVFAPKIQYKLVAERGEANLQNLQFPQWCAGKDSNLRSP